MSLLRVELDWSGWIEVRDLDDLPGGSGLYAVWAAPVERRRGARVAIEPRLLWLGESKAIRGRVFGHERWDDWSRELQFGERLLFTWALTPFLSKLERRAVECALIGIYEPAVNITCVAPDAYTFTFGVHVAHRGSTMGVLTGLDVVLPALETLRREAVPTAWSRWTLGYAP